MKDAKQIMNRRFSEAKHEWYGTGIEFTKSFNHNYNNTSFEKILSNKRLEVLHNRNLQIQHLKNQKQIDNCKVLSERLETVNEKVRNINAKLREKEAEELLMNKAAIIIQKCVKGYFTRKRMEIVRFI